MTITVGVAGTFTPSAYIQKSVLSNGSSTLTCSDTTGIVVGQFVKDTGLILVVLKFLHLLLIHQLH